MVAGEQPVELEGGEWIIPKEAVPDYLPVLKQITNEGRAMQQMDNGNTAMDALIASASMETGLSQPRSPMYQEGGEVGWGDFTTPEDFNKHLVYNKIYDKMVEANGRGTGYSDALSRQVALSDEGDPKQLLMDRMMERSAYGNGVEQHGVLEDTKFKDLTSGLEMGSELTAVPRFKVSREYAKEGDLEKRVGTSREQVSLGSLPVLSALSSLASKAGVTPESKIGRLLNAPLPLTLEKDIPSGKRSYSLGYTPEYQKQGGPVNYYQEGGQLQLREAPYKGSDRLPYAGEDSIQSIIERINANREFDVNPYFTPEYQRYQKAHFGLTGNADAPPGAGELERIAENYRQESATKAYIMNQLLESGGYDSKKDLEEDYLRTDVKNVLPKYQQGGQMQPRRQQEIRNPEVYGPPVPANLDSVLQQIMMRDVNESINPFTGKSLDFEGDSLRLLQRMNESRGDTTRTGMPLSPYGQNLQRGGLVMYANGGQIGEGQPLERRYGEAAGGESPGGYFPLASQAEPGALMGSIRSDRRIKPLQPDTYLQKIPLAKPFYKSNLAHPLHQEEVEEVPKLSTAYLASFGMETPLSRRQGALLYRKGIAPQTLNPQVKGLINRALVQRLTNEDD